MDSLLEKEVKLIKKKGPTIPFGYKTAEKRKGYFEPVQSELDSLDLMVNYVKGKGLSLREACDWLYYKTDRKISPAGLLKIIKTRY
jgi:hypothetical protein